MDLDESLRPMVIELHLRLGGRVRELSLSQFANRLVLRGQSKTYYAKQLAQEVVLSFADEALVVNEIDVL